MSVTKSTYLYRYAIYSHANQPKINSQNEDALLAVGEVRQGNFSCTGEVTGQMANLFAVSDGVHCSPHPAYASRFLLKSLNQLWQHDADQLPGKRLAALQEIYNRHARRHQRYAGITATLVAAELRERSALIYHVGDSAAWLVRDGVAKKLTRDHTILERMIDEGEVNREQADDLATIYSGLDRYFTAQTDEEKPQHEQRCIELLTGDILLLASDGIADVTAEDIAAQVAHSQGNMAKLAENIFHQAVRAGSDDNITLIAIKVAHDAEIDPLFAAAKQMVIETRTPSVALVQRTFLINYTRASSFLDAMEGEIVSPKDERGARRMLTGETVDYL